VELTIVRERRYVHGDELQVLAQLRARNLAPVLSLFSFPDGASVVGCRASTPCKAPRPPMSRSGLPGPERKVFHESSQAASRARHAS
jgi:hypothetical protein